MKEKGGYVYIMTNKKHGTLYTGVTNNLVRRVYEHREHIIEGFTKKYGLNKLVYYETFDNIEDVIFREKQIKGGSRKKKISLIESINSNWNDLYEDIVY